MSAGVPKFIPRWLRVGAIAATLGAMLVLPSGCNIASGVSYLALGLPKKPAMYTLLDVPTVVYVDDRANVIGTNARAVRITIADMVSTQLMTENLVTEVISSRDAMGITMRQDRHQDLMPIDAIARSVGADQIIYVEMVSFGLAADATTPAPVAMCQVRVIDAVRKVRLFPTVDEADTTRVAYPVRAIVGEVDPSAMRAMSSRVRVYEMLAEEMGFEISRLFYDHVPKDLGSNL
jgi:hypothetical protein